MWKSCSKHLDLEAEGADVSGGEPCTFHLVDPEGQMHRVPFHRVREVYKNAQRIWHRPQET